MPASSYGAVENDDDGYGTTQSVVDGEFDADRMEAQSRSAETRKGTDESDSQTDVGPSQQLKMKNRTVVAFGSIGLLMLTFGTFFLVMNNRSGVTKWDTGTSVVMTSSESSSSVTGGVVTESDEDDGAVFHVTLADDESTLTATTLTLEFSVQRCNYSVIDFFSGSPEAPLTYKILEDHVGVLEPYAPMELAMIKDLSARTGFKQVVTYQYSIADSDGNVVADSLTSYAEESDGTSDTFSIGCTPGDVYTISIDRYSGADLTNSGSGTLLCKYVRREYRSLTDEDLSSVMDAMYAMWTVPTKKGQKKYGEDFYDADFFTDVHFYNAGFRDSDHIHEGLGFMAQHIKMTNMFEKAMQSVDPSVSLFYWDFTIDTVQGLSVYDSPYFSASTFGSIPQPKNFTAGWTFMFDDLEDAKIPDGRWANLEAQMNDKYDDIKQAYGFMRSPWNMNPSKYISRFSIGPPFVNLPGCGNYKEWFEEKDFAASMKESAYGPHSTTHTAVGGVYGCDTLDSFREQGLILDNSLWNQQSICLKWGFYIKEYYRGNYLTPNEDCDEENSASCFTCNSDSVDDMLSMMKSSSLKNYVAADITDEGWVKWHDFVCAGASHKIFVGDHLESASPADPSFWPIHPTQERLLQARYANGGFWDFDWPKIGTAVDYVCNHFECYDDESQVLKTNDTSCCYGHYEYDQLYYPGDRTKVIGDTNHKVLKDLDSNSENYAMPYIYDSFAWSHCGDLFDVSAIATALEEKALSLDSTGQPLTSSTAASDSGDGSGVVVDVTSTSKDSKGYSTVLASSSRQGARGGSQSSASESDGSDTGVEAASSAATTSDSKGYSTVLASDSRWSGRAKGWGDLDDDHVPENRH